MWIESYLLFSLYCLIILIVQPAITPLVRMTFFCDTITKFAFNLYVSSFCLYLFINNIVQVELVILPRSIVNENPPEQQNQQPPPPPPPPQNQESSEEQKEEEDEEVCQISKTST